MANLLTDYGRAYASNTWTVCNFDLLLVTYLTSIDFLKLGQAQEKLTGQEL